MQVWLSNLAKITCAIEILLQLTMHVSECYANTPTDGFETTMLTTENQRRDRIQIYVCRNCPG